LISAGAPPETLLGELTALPQTSELDLNGLTSKVREGAEERERNGEGGKRGGEGREKRGEGGKGYPVPDWESKKVATLAKTSKCQGA